MLNEILLFHCLITIHLTNMPLPDICYASEGKLEYKKQFIQLSHVCSRYKTMQVFIYLHHQE